MVVAIIVIILASTFVMGNDKVEIQNTDISNQEQVSISNKEKRAEQAIINVKEAGIEDEEQETEQQTKVEEPGSDSNLEEKSVSANIEISEREPEATNNNEKANTSENKKITTETKEIKQADNTTPTTKTTKITTSTEAIPYKTIEQTDSSIEQGKKKVSREGKNGVRTITYEEIYDDGKLASKKELSSQVTTKPVDKIVNVGTKDPANVWYDYTYEVIKFKVIEQKDPTLEIGKWKVIQPGRIGKQKTTYKNTQVDGELIPRVEVVSKDVVTEKPINKIVKVGTKAVPASTVFLSADEAHQMLSSSGLFKQFGNIYSFYFTGWSEYEFQIEVGNNHIARIHFDGLTYSTWKSTSKQELVELLGAAEAEAEWQATQRETKRLESALRVAANAVYGSGTPEANSLYNEIINEGTNRYFIRNY